MKSFEQWLQEHYPNIVLRPAYVVPLGYRVEYLEEILLNAMTRIDYLEKQVIALSHEPTYELGTKESVERLIAEAKLKGNKTE